MTPRSELEMRESQLEGMLIEGDDLQRQLDQLPWWAWRQRSYLAMAIRLNGRSVRMAARVILSMRAQARRPEGSR